MIFCCFAVSLVAWGENIPSAPITGITEEDKTPADGSPSGLELEGNDDNNEVVRMEEVCGRCDSTATGGSYIWIPDSLNKDVKRLLGGKYIVVHDDSRVDVNERVIYRGDTLNMVLRDKNPRILHRYDRKLYNYLFIPRGEWQLGLTASYAEFSTDDLQMFDILSDFTFKGHIFSVKPYVAYFIKENMSVGIRINYTNGQASLNSLSLDISDDMGFSVNDVGYTTESYEAAIFFRQYLGLARNGRFGIFNEVSLGFSSGNSKFERPFDGDMRSSRTTNMRASLNFSPGVCIMVMRNVSFNLSFGVFGFYIKNERQTLNGEDLGNRFTSGADFRLNIFNINFGLGFHF